MCPIRKLFPYAAFFGFLGLSSFAYAADDVHPAFAEHLPTVIQAYNMRCHTVNRVTMKARTERGDVFEVICDRETAFYRYRVIMTPDRKLIIRPWSE
jgi:hypothetical protein